MQSDVLAFLIDNSSDTVSSNKAPEEQHKIIQEENESQPIRPAWFLDSAHPSSDRVWPYFTQEFWWDLKVTRYFFILKINYIF